MTREEASRILSTRDNQGMPVTWQKGFLEAYDMAIEALKAETWIPCSERLPSAEHNLKGFFTTIKCYDENDVFIQVYENGKFGHWDGEKLIPNDDVIAWMERPEPWKGENNEQADD